MPRSLGQILSVRVTKEQYDLLEQLRQSDGGRSVSDVARRLINEAMERVRAAQTNEEASARRLESMLLAMHEELRNLLRSITRPNQPEGEGCGHPEVPPRGARISDMHAGPEKAAR